MTPTLLGQNIACLFHDVDPRGFKHHQGVAEHLENWRSPDYGQLSKMAASFAANCYQAVDDTGVEFQLYNLLRKQATWYPAFDQFTDPVLDVIARNLGEDFADKAAAEDLDKQAAVRGILAGLAGKSLTATPTAVKFVMGAGAAAGAGAGALYWAMNRHSSEDEANIEAMKVKLKHYNKITREISEDLRRRGVTVTPADTVDTIKENAGTDNIVT